MNIMGLCSICGKPSAIHTCTLCGKLVCEKCYDNEHNICKNCKI